MNDSVWRVCIVEDTEMIRSTFEKMIEADERFQLDGSFSNVQDLSSFIDSDIRPHVILLDVFLPEKENDILYDYKNSVNQRGLFFGLEIKREYGCEIGILFTSAFISNEIIRLISDAGFEGGFGFVQKNNNRDTILYCLNEVAKGGKIIDYRSCIPHLKVPVKSLPTIEKFTEAEIEVLKMIGNGFSVKQIANKTGKSEKTIYGERSSIIEKLERDGIRINSSVASSNIHLTHFAISIGLVELFFPENGTKYESEK